MFCFAQPVSEDMRRVLSILFRQPLVEAPVSHTALPCGECGMILAVVAEVAEAYKSGVQLRCPLCAGWMKMQIEDRAGGWAQVMPAEGTKSV